MIKIDNDYKEYQNKYILLDTKYNKINNEFNDYKLLNEEKLNN